ncbi:MAG: hypothetical protein QG552_1415, partial [Thermodesulfobacteriota bacterium]|nr:hypothetical protein [Thermodesulfobacteriota bacterium]
LKKIAGRADAITQSVLAGMRAVKGRLSALM